MRTDRLIVQILPHQPSARVETLLSKLLGPTADLRPLGPDCYGVTVYDSPETVIDFALSLRAASEDIGAEIRALEVPYLHERFERFLPRVPARQLKTLVEVSAGEKEIFTECYALIASIDEELLTTVKQYLESGRSPTLTARRLYVHRNTVTYRVERFEAESTLCLKAPATAMFVYQLLSSYLAAIHQGGSKI